VTRPRVLHLVDAFGARSQTFVYTFVTNHDAFDAAVVCRERNLPVEFPFDHVTVIPESWSRLQPSRWWSLLVSTVSRRSPWQRRVQRAVRTSAPHIVHAHFGQVGVRVLPAIEPLDIPLVTSFYGYDATGFANSRRGRESLPALFAFGALFLAEGPVMRRRLIALGAPADRVRVVPIAIDLHKYPRWAPADDRPYALFLARFVEKKGLPDAISAFARARATCPELTLRIIGDGPEETRGREAVLAHGIAEHVEWLGPRTHAECIDAMRRARVLIQPSVTARDGDSEGGAPTTLIEAQAIGTPIVATRHADIPHVAPPGEGIHLADEHDVEQLAVGMTRLVRAAVSSHSAGVRERHDIKHVMPLLERCYGEALSASRRSAA
jgi:colanic acid/amylovoran biosynthesis glycosyltransferase